MTSRIFVLRRIFTLLICLLPVSTWAYTPIVTESGGQTRLGWPINEAGTKYGPDSGPILVRINTLRLEDDAEPTTLSDEDLALMTESLIEAMSYWNNITGSFAEFEFDGYEEATDPTDLRDYLLVTNYILDGAGGRTYYEVEDGVYMPTGVLLKYTDDVDTLIHELGHALGLGHSEMTDDIGHDDLLQHAHGTPSMMSGVYSLDVADDDIAAMRARFPTPSRKPSKLATIRGRLLDGESQPIFGARAFVVDADGVPVSGVITGLNTYRGDGEFGSSFEIANLEAGTYTLVLASQKSLDFSNLGQGEPDYPSMSLDDHYASQFKDSVIGAIILSEGETLDLGAIHAGTITGLLKYHSEFNWDAVEGAQGYLVEVYDIAKDRPLPTQRVDENRMVVRGLDKGVYEATVTALMGRGASAVPVLSGARFEFHPDVAIYPGDYVNTDPDSDVPYVRSAETYTDNGFDVRVSYQTVIQEGETNWYGIVKGSHESGEPINVDVGLGIGGFENGDPDSWFYMTGGTENWSYRFYCDLAYNFNQVSLEPDEKGVIKTEWERYNDQGQHEITLRIKAGGEELLATIHPIILDDEQHCIVGGYAPDSPDCYDTHVGYFQQDSDGDFVPDVDDVYPNNRHKAYDADGDGITDAKDSDSDNDGVLDIDDACPLDAGDWVDTDGDQVCDNADDFPEYGAYSSDRDGDGVPDELDYNDGVDDIVTVPCVNDDYEQGTIPAGEDYICVLNSERSESRLWGDAQVEISGVLYAVDNINQKIAEDADGNWIGRVTFHEPLQHDIPVGTVWSPVTPDSDFDGTLDGDDDDIDGDGVHNDVDLDPMDPSMSIDLDADGVDDDDH